MALTGLRIPARLIVGKTLSDLNSLLHLTQQLRSLEPRVCSAAASVCPQEPAPCQSLSPDPLEMAAHSQTCLLLSSARPRYSVQKTRGIHSVAQRLHGPPLGSEGQRSTPFLLLSHFAL